MSPGFRPRCAARRRPSCAATIPAASARTQAPVTTSTFPQCCAAKWIDTARPARNEPSTQPRQEPVLGCCLLHRRGDRCDGADHAADSVLRDELALPVARLSPGPTAGTTLPPPPSEDRPRLQQMEGSQAPKTPEAYPAGQGDKSAEIRITSYRLFSGSRSCCRREIFRRGCYRCSRRAQSPE